MIHYRRHSRSSIQWLYLCHRFAQVYLHQRHLSDTHTEIQPTHQFLVESIEHLVGEISTVLDNALLDFNTATMCPDDTIHTTKKVLSVDTSYCNLPLYISVDAIEHFVGSMSSILDKEILDFNADLQRLDDKIQAIEFAFEDYGHPEPPTTQSITSNQHEIPASNLGPIAHHMPIVATTMSIPLPSPPIYHQHSADNGTISRHFTPAPVSSAPQGRHEQDRTAATPSFSPSTPMDSSHGCNTSLTSDDGPRTNLQPHEFVSNNNNTKHEKNLTTIYTQNAQGLWRRPRDADGNILVDNPPDLSKLEYLIDYMRQNDVGAWLIQETWEEGDEFDIDVDGYHIFRHNATRGESGRQHLFRGVAIILSPLFYDAWKAAGSPPPLTTDNDSVGRFIRMNFQFESFDTRGRRIKGKFLLMTLISAYFPCDDQRHDQFCAMLDSMLSTISPTTQIVLGSDINARIGIRNCDEHKETIGPHGIDRSNARGENLLQVLTANKLRVENTFFQHRPNEYATYTSLPTPHHPRGIPSMHDIFACSTSFHKRIQDCAAVVHGVASDHLAVCLTVALSSVKFKKHTVSRGTTNWAKILSDDHARMEYNEHLLQLTTNDMDYDEYQEAILQAGALTATHHKRKCNGWFQMSRITLAPLITERNQVLHAIKRNHHLSPAIHKTMQADLKRLNRHIAHAVSHAKATWYADICSKIHNMCMDPRLAWEHIRLLTKGEAAHHEKKTAMAMRLPDGSRATNASENMSVFAPHFHRVYNAERATDPTILAQVPQRRTMWELNDPITWDEFSKAVRKLKNAKAPGLTGVPPEAFKAMSPTNLHHIYDYVNDFFMGDVDHEQWHRSKCVCVPKSGDLSDPNKWRGVMLMDVCSKIFSSVMNGRAFRLLEEHGTRFQFGGTPTLGCRDGLFVLKTLLTMRKNHNLSSHVAFVDLVKAYDTANHDLLLDILERYGAPPRFVAAIARTYQDLVVVLKIEKEVVELPQTVGVRQGDNMAPVLFLFLMSAFAETLKAEWKREQIGVCTV